MSPAYRTDGARTSPLASGVVADRWEPSSESSGESGSPSPIGGPAKNDGRCDAGSTATSADIRLRIRPARKQTKKTVAAFQLRPSSVRSGAVPPLRAKMKRDTPATARKASAVIKE